MFKNRSKFPAMLMLAFVLLTGCWDSTDVNNQNLVTMVILDKQGDTFSFIVEIAKVSPLGESASGAGPQKQVYLLGTGKDFAQARDSLDMQMDKPAFLGTVRALVLTERAAANDFTEYMFRLRENQEYRQKVNITITAEEPKALTEYENENDKPAGFIIDNTIVTATMLGHTCAVTTEDYINDILRKRGFLIQHIALTDRQIKLDGYSVFRDAKLAGFIPMEESHGMTYILAKHPVWVYRLPGGGGYVTAEVELSGRTVKPSYQAGRTGFQIRLSFKATIQYNSDPILFPMNAQNMEKLSGDLNQVLASEVRMAIEQSQVQFQCDYLRLGEAFRIAYPDVYDQMDWLSEYPKAEIEVGTYVDLSVSEKMDIEAP